ncbi:hypothetical protein OAU92_03165 [Acidimicrobiia bacterium]|nr:hypothetical protein [Acidimicrobiia bacterium]
MNYDYISSYKIARSCDVVFSEVVTPNQFIKLDIKNYSIIYKNSRQVFYKLDSFEVTKNITIFTNSHLLENLFRVLKNVPSDYNITLITNQTDFAVTSRVYDSKPGCINIWYSINVDSKSLNLIPIPLGLSNDYSPKNLLANDLKNIKFDANSKKSIFFYVNFSKNTNRKEREKLYDKFRDRDWAYLQENNLTKKNYYSELSSSEFCLSPFGNGIDTHRIWESLYLNVIPVTKYHHTFSSVQNLPILFVNDYNEITLDLLETFKKNYIRDDYNFKLLENYYWTDKINVNTTNSSDNSIHLNISYLYKNYIKFEYLFKEYIKRITKIIIFNTNKLSKVSTLVFRRNAK